RMSIQARASRAPKAALSAPCELLVAGHWLTGNREPRTLNPEPINPEPPTPPTPLAVRPHSHNAASDPRDTPGAGFGSSQTRTRNPGGRASSQVIPENSQPAGPCSLHKAPCPD